MSRGGALMHSTASRWARGFYDVWCQYAVKADKRFTKLKFPEAKAEFFELMTKRMVGGIPSMHIRGHIAKCRAVYTVPHLKYTGETPTEMVETPWAETKKIGGSVKHENHGQRNDDLDGLFANWNHQKLIRMRMY